MIHVPDWTLRDLVAWRQPLPEMPICVHPSSPPVSSFSQASSINQLTLFNILFPNLFLLAIDISPRSLPGRRWCRERVMKRLHQQECKDSARTISH
jgi:hypothetical protein